MGPAYCRPFFAPVANPKLVGCVHVREHANHPVMINRLITILLLIDVWRSLQYGMLFVNNFDDFSQTCANQLKLNEFHVVRFDDINDTTVTDFECPKLDIVFLFHLQVFTVISGRFRTFDDDISSTVTLALELHAVIV